MPLLIMATSTDSSPPVSGRSELTVNDLSKSPLTTGAKPSGSVPSTLENTATCILLMLSGTSILPTDPSDKSAKIDGMEAVHFFLYQTTN